MKGSKAVPPRTLIVHRIIGVLASTLLLMLPVAAAAQADLAAHVDPFIGVDGGGNVLAGASVPFGFVSLGPDTARGSTNGYDSASPIIGFSSTHVSGTGGDSKYGNFRVTPTVGPIRPGNLRFERSDESAAPGYYSVILGNTRAERVRAELTATPWVGFHRYTFPVGAEGNLLIDATSSILVGGGGQKSTAAEVHVIGDRDIAGFVVIAGGWGGADSYKLFFHATFDRPFAGSGSFSTGPGSFQLAANARHAIGGDQKGDPANQLGAYATFDISRNTRVQMKLAVSFTSSEKALRHIREQAPGWDFSALQQAGRQKWNDALGKIQVEGGTLDQQKVFYTALYRNHAMPHDVTGENVWWSSAEPHYEQFYAIWDTFRTTHPLLTLIQPDRQRGMIRSLLDTYKHTGWMPDARIAGGNGVTQGGSNSDVLIADAVTKNLGGFDLGLAYEAMKKNADVDSPDPTREGRALRQYIALGFMPLTETRSGSRTVEYAYNDFATSVVAERLGRKADAERYRQRSGNWRNLWDPRIKCIHPRYADGSWLENFDCGYVYPDATAGWWDHPFYEGSGFVYSNFVPHDTVGLMSIIGGREAFVQWLDAFFDEGHYDQGNEPSFLASFNYIFAGRHDRTAERVRKIMLEQYRPTRDGWPGNDDSGAMSAWYVWNATGLYPNAGQPYYFIGSPLFRRSTFRLEHGKLFSIIANGVSVENRYVQSARLNGKRLDRAWVAHAELGGGGTLELEMGPKPSKWASTLTQPPNQ